MNQHYKLLGGIGAVLVGIFAYTILTDDEDNDKAKDTHESEDESDDESESEDESEDESESESEEEGYFFSSPKKTKKVKKNDPYVDTNEMQEDIKPSTNPKTKKDKVKNKSSKRKTSRSNNSKTKSRSGR